ncbi:hypothetical protein Tco_0625514 [Tanacetum coccineum]|uniref:Uncharacterized protein n=1 Tax=Tanacetum coccineum TaxID=301880 RepID=A0ABQ4WH35_9ASTR
MERAATTASSLEAEQDTLKAQTRFEAASKPSNDPPLSRVNTLGSEEDSMKPKELMELVAYHTVFYTTWLLSWSKQSTGKVKALSDSGFSNFSQSGKHTSNNGNRLMVMLKLASVRKYLKLADAGGVSSLPNTEIFDQLSLMGYAITSDKLFFSIGHCPSVTPVADEAAFTGVNVVHGGVATIVSRIDAR